MGRFTASTFKDLFMGKKTAGYEKAILTPVHERFTGERPDSYYGYHMRRGHEMEPFTVEEYERQNFVEVKPGGFFALGEWIGASPDGLIGDDGLLEGKSPAWNTVIKYILSGTLPDEYFWQVHGQLYVTDRAWCDFTVYHPDFDLLVLRVERDEEIEKRLVEELDAAITKASDILETLRGKAA